MISTAAPKARTSHPTTTTKGPRTPRRPGSAAEKVLLAVVRTRRMLRGLVDTLNDAGIAGADSDCAMDSFTVLARTESAIREYLAEERWTARRAGGVAMPAQGAGVASSQRGGSGAGATTEEGGIR